MTMTDETQWNEDEEKVFSDLGIGEHESLKRLIRGQRKINGKFFLAIQTIIECFEPKADLDQNAKQRVEAALKFVREIPDVDPPRCEDPSKTSTS
jgi:hypothetical protein